MSEKNKKEGKNNAKHRKEDESKEIKKVEEELEKIEEEIEEEANEISNKVVYIGIITLLVGLIIGLSLGLISKKVNNSGENLNNLKTIDKKEAMKYVENTLYDLFAKQIILSGQKVDFDLSAVDIKDEGYFYNVSVELIVNGQKSPKPMQVFIDKEGKYVILGNVIPVTKEINKEELKSKLDKIGEITNKTDKPKVILAVMSDCPYGNLIEPEFLPIIQELGDKIEFEPRYIFYRGSNPYGTGDVEVDGNKYWSLHGNYELNQGLFELAVWKLYGSKVWVQFVNRVNSECLSKSNKKEIIEECAENIAKDMGLDVDKIKKYLEQHKEELIKEQTKLTNDLGIQGSPTLIINGQRYSGSRDAQSIKKAICSAFINPPEECNNSGENSNVQNSATETKQVPQASCGAQ